MFKQIPVVLAFLISPASAGESAVTLNGSQLVVNGEIDRAMADKVHNLIKGGNVVSIKITSPGGLDLPALSIARDVYNKKVGIIVDHYCMSACASYIFVAAPDRNILPNSLVVFHDTAASQLPMVPPLMRNNLSKDYGEISKETAELYDAVHVSRSLILEPQVRIRPKCYALVHAQSGDGNDAAFISQFRAWIPTKEYMNAAGIQFRGYWPEMSDAAAVIGSLFKANVSILFGGPKAPKDINELIADVSSTPACTAEQRALILRSVNH